MKVLLMTPPHTNPVGPTLGIAVLSAHIKQKFPDVEVQASDQGLDAMYWLLSEKTIQQAIGRLEESVGEAKGKNALSYEEQRTYSRSLGALCVLKKYGEDVSKAMLQVKDIETYKIDNIRNNANFIINKVLEGIACAWPGTQLNAGDYRTELSPFCIEDIEQYVQNPEKSIYNDFFDEWLKKNDLSDVELLGLSISFAKQMLPSFLFADKVKQKYPHLFIAVGGSMMAHLNSEAFKPLFQWCDCIIQREGEYPLEHLVDAILCGKALSPSMGVLYLSEDGELVQCEKMPRVHLEQEPTPDFSGFQLKDYLVPSPNVPLQIGRSCYWGKCTFCCLNSAFEYRNCWTKVEKLVDDIEKLVASQGVKTIEFVDDAIPPAFARSLSEELIKRNCKIKWFCYARFDSGFDETLLARMHQSGCVGLKFGLESASPRISRLMNKGIDLEKAAEIFEMTERVGIIPQAAFFFGFPGEQREDIWRTVRFIENYVVKKGIIAYNGKFRLLKSMPLLQEPEKYGIKNIKKWNTKEGLIDYYEVEMKTKEMEEDSVNEAEQYLVGIIEKDLTRSVDQRRYWFEGYGESQVEMNTEIFCESEIPLDEIVIMQDKKNGDFLPGKGIYSKKSYISDGLHAEEIMKGMNQLRKPVCRQKTGKYYYDAKTKKFRKV